MLEQLKKFFFRRALTQRLAALDTFARQPRAYTDAHNIGILVDATHAEDRATVVRYVEKLRNEGKHVEVRGYMATKAPTDAFAFKCLNLRSLDWSGMPKEEATDTFCQTSFDILLNLYTRPYAPLEVMSALAKAHLRTGATNAVTDWANIPAFDLHIDLGNDNSLPHLIEQTDFYMRWVNKVSEQ